MSTPGYLVLLVAVCTCLPVQPLRAQSLTGISGLVLTPVATMPEDGTVTIGGGFIHRRHASLEGGARHYVPYYGSIAFLPFLEVGFRFTRPITDEPVALGDRMIMARLQLLRERKWTPAVTVGAHDFLRSSDTQTSHFNALYVVGSKQVVSSGWHGSIDVHLGYGVDWLPARQHEFAGVFGGVEVSPTGFLDLLAEYDSRVVSAGARINLPYNVHLLVALRGADAPVAGGFVSFRL